ncbi:cation diffusion facilitator family transporter [Mycetocola spongiae]|uniref:cation diffusion facilitator family transporter n=1 Tax=Mycetocola spongiae TaxID=2859226 RepID=UPI001CF5C8C1|nr:cation diffusion facilitator family transporter [Mycetocola spongiae]UCR89095.1 cation diffusion facilitator family transporter [Mycetocola spongiae]
MAHDHAPVNTSKKRLLVVICIVATVLIAEVIGGILTGSLALLADAGHMLSDLTGLFIALFAMTIAAKPASDRATYGYRRTEVFGALANGLILCAVAVGIAIEAFGRLMGPGDTEVIALPMLLVAIVGLIANLVSMLILRAGAKDSINMRGAYLEVFGDMLGSVAVIVAAIVIMLTGWVQADAVVSLLIAVFILPRAFLLLRDVWRVLNESTPVGTDLSAVRSHMMNSEGVSDVHDLHLWAITTGEHVFTAHVVVTDEVFAAERVGATLDRLTECLHDHFDVEHVTLQLEPATHAAHEAHTHD